MVWSLFILNNKGGDTLARKEKGLTDKQEMFVQEMVKGKSQREAYKSAFNSNKMKDTTIDSKASILFKDGKIRARYEDLKGKVRDKAEQDAIMSAVEVLKEIESIAADDISNYIEFGTWETEEGPKPYVRLKNNKQVNTKNVSEISVGANGTFKIKMYGRDTALYKLAEIYGIDVLKQAKQKLAEERFVEEKRINDIKNF